jgi:hypothetical protein
MNDVRRFTVRLLVIGGFALPIGAVIAPGCGGLPSDVCDVICECERCNDRAEDECLIRANRRQDTAAAYGCEDESDDYGNCVVDNNNCEQSQFQPGTRCNDDYQILLDCMVDNSAVINISSGNNGQTGPDQSGSPDQPQG